MKRKKRIIDGLMAETSLYVLVLVGIVAFCSSSCKTNERREQSAMIVDEWTGKEIKFPENIPCYVSGLETFPEKCDEYFHKEFKILFYVDSTGCSSCRLKLFEWKQLVEEVDSLYPGKVGFLLYFQPKEIKDIDFLFLRDRFDYPVFMDTGNEINCLNRFPRQQLFQSFLLDGDNKVLCIGNPTLNPKIWDLYKFHIEGKDIIDPDPKIFTTTMAEKTLHDYGSFRKGSANYADFEIMNTGNYPLVISRISVACGCTRVTWDKQPIAAGLSTTIRVEMTPDKTGPFNKTVVVYCNTEGAPTKLTVTGITIE